MRPRPERVTVLEGVGVVGRDPPFGVLEGVVRLRPRLRPVELGFIFPRLLVIPLVVRSGVLGGYGVLDHGSFVAWPPSRWLRLCHGGRIAVDVEALEVLSEGLWFGGVEVGWGRGDWGGDDGEGGIDAGEEEGGTHFACLGSVEGSDFSWYGNYMMTFEGKLLGVLPGWRSDADLCSRREMIY